MTHFVSHSFYENLIKSQTRELYEAAPLHSRCSQTKKNYNMNFKLYTTQKYLIKKSVEQKKNSTQISD
jgi:hypothetical protein